MNKITEESARREFIVYLVTYLKKNPAYFRPRMP